MTSNPSPAIERQLREAWARKEWEYSSAQEDWTYCHNDRCLADILAIMMAESPQGFIGVGNKDKDVPANWRDQCKPPLDDEGDE